MYYAERSKVEKIISVSFQCFLFALVHTKKVNTMI
jgi:hypothetical protein